MQPGKVPGVMLNSPVWTQVKGKVLGIEHIHSLTTQQTQPLLIYVLSTVLIPYTYSQSLDDKEQHDSRFLVQQDFLESDTRF